MPIAKVQLPDGRIGRFEVPEGTTEAQVLEFAKQNIQGEEQPTEQPQPDIKQQQPNQMQTLMQDLIDGNIDENRKGALHELNKRGLLDKLYQQTVSTTPEQQEQFRQLQGEVQKPSPATQALSGVLEPAAMVGTGAVNEIVSGLGAVRTLLQTGDLSKADKVLKQFQEQFVAIPQTESGKAGAQALGKAVGVVAEPLGKLVKGSGAAAEEIAGPYAGATVETLLRFSPELIPFIGKLAKMGKLEKLNIKKLDDLYDELGQLKPEIKQGLEGAGVTVDDLKSIAPTQEALEASAQQIGKAAKTGKKVEQVAEEVMPDVDILKAAEELDIGDKLLPSHSSQNPVYVSLEQALKKVPGSQLAAKERGAVEALGTKADDFIKEFGGEIDKSLLSDKFKTESLDIIDSISKQESKLFDEIAENIPVNFKVKTDNIISSLNAKADSLGGTKYLDKTEKMILKDLGQKSSPTYARLDKYRKLIGSAFKNKGPWKDADQGALRQMYKSLAEDQKAFTKKMGYSDLYETANKLTVARKGIEDKLSRVLGKELTGSIATKGKAAILGLQKGETKAFDELVENIPKELSPERRRSIFVTALNDAFVQGSRKEKALSVPGFDDFMTGINRNKSAKTRLTKEIGVDAMKRIGTLHKVVGGVRKAQSAVGEVPRIFDTVDSVAGKLYGFGKLAAGAKGAALGAIEKLADVKRTPRSVAADELLSSNKFQKIIRDKATLALNTNQKINRANELISQIDAYKKWEKTLPETDIADIAAVGVIGYLIGEKQLKENN